MKYIGIDYGSKHVGIAVSDASGSVAMPKCIVPNDKRLIAVVSDIITHEGIERIVIGESKDFQGAPNAIQSAIDTFVHALQDHTGLEVHKTSELFSSKLAKRGTEHVLRVNPRNLDKRDTHKKVRRIDDKAAAIMLQSYLDSVPLT